MLFTHFVTWRVWKCKKIDPYRFSQLSNFIFFYNFHFVHGVWLDLLVPWYQDKILNNFSTTNSILDLTVSLNEQDLKYCLMKEFPSFDNSMFHWRLICYDITNLHYFTSIGILKLLYPYAAAADLLLDSFLRKLYLIYSIILSLKRSIAKYFGYT